MIAEVIGAAALAGLGLGIIAWGLSLKMTDTSIVDRFWGLLFIAGAGAAWIATKNSSLTFLVIFAAVTIWGLRLSIFIHLRNRGNPEDRRYAAMRANHPGVWWWRSLFTVFTLQAILMVIIGTPIWYLASLLDSTPTTFFWVGVAVWLGGFVIETIADGQMSKFRGNPENAGKVMDRGLWGLSRHPNYFGEAMLWWGIGIMAVAQGGWWSLLGPVTITFSLLRVSGVTLLEKDLKDRKPEYHEYIRKTSPFVPWFRRK